MCTRVDTKEFVLDVLQIPTREGGNFEGEKGLAQECPDMSDGRYIQSVSVGAAPVRCGCRMGCTCI